MTPRRRDRRFDQLLALAREGNEEAKSDLFKEYGFDADRQSDSAHRLPQRKDRIKNNKHEET